MFGELQPVNEANWKPQMLRKRQKRVLFSVVSPGIERLSSDSCHVQVKYTLLGFRNELKCSL